MTDSPKPAFGSGPFSQSGFGSQPSGGFSGGSFSAQGGSVASSGFGFGASSSSGINCLNCIFPSPLSSFTFDGGFYRPFEVKLDFTGAYDSIPFSLYYRVRFATIFWLVLYWRVCVWRCTFIRFSSCIWRCSTLWWLASGRPRCQSIWRVSVKPSCLFETRVWGGGCFLSDHSIILTMEEKE